MKFSTIFSRFISFFCFRSDVVFGHLRTADQPAIFSRFIDASIS